MDINVLVIALFQVYDASDKRYTLKVLKETFKSLNDALDSISSYDYPPVKITIHLL